MELHIIACPDPLCGLPAEVVDRFTFSSTDGPIEHVRTYCLHRHIFTVPSARVAAKPRVRSFRGAA